MKGPQKIREIKAKLHKLICFYLSVGMIIMGLPVNLFAAGPVPAAIADPVPAKIVFDTEFTATRTTYYKPHQLIKLKARAYNKDGIEVPCTMKYKAFNPLGDKVVTDGAPGTGNELIGRFIDNTGSEFAVSQVGLGSGNARVEASCEEKPDVKARQQINSKGEFMTTEELNAEKARIREMQAQGSFTNYKPLAQQTPAGPKPASATQPASVATEGSTGAAGSGIGTGTILLGVGAVGAIGVLALAAGALGSQCAAGYAPCGSYDVCCQDLYKYCPSNGQCYSSIFNSCPGSTVTCHN